MFDTKTESTKEPFRRNTPLEDLIATIIMTTIICAVMIGILSIWIA